MKRQFLQLSHNYDPVKHRVNGWFLSEKLDGIRAFWDGGITKGMLASDIPWANVEKDARLKNPPIATGLWSRYGKVIFAPEYWINMLPPFPLDGELWIKRRSWQLLSTVVKRHNPGPEWEDVKYVIFDAPSYYSVFADGTINEPNFRKEFRGIYNWLTGKDTVRLTYNHEHFETIYARLKRLEVENSIVKVHEQEQLPFSTVETNRIVEERLESILSVGGEGVILRKHTSVWEPKRTTNCLKYKPYEDAEATVIGYKWGREGKLLGKMGALSLRMPNGKEFELSGFTDEERLMKAKGTGNSETLLQRAHEEGEKHPGEVVTPDFFNPMFPIGTVVTYVYRELTESGLPKEGRYLRCRNSSLG